MSFPLPSYQENAGVPPSANPGKNVGRGVPDVAADADPATGYSVRVDGNDTVIGGTSAVAPLVGWSGRMLEPGPGQAGRLSQPDALRPYRRAAASFATSPAATTAPTRPGPAGTRAAGLGVADGSKLLTALSSVE